MQSDKIVEIDELSNFISNAKAEGKKIAHCHGVFDLIHPGHVRHLKEAKTFGDILIVTITPDRYVNKGPHRPVFNENLRAEVLASFEIIDFIAINKWPTAVETIHLLKPDVYVKGVEYKDPDQDYTKGISAEETAVLEVGGQIQFTEDITFSSSELVNKYLDVFSSEIKQYLTGFSMKYSSDEIINHLEKIKELKILVIGEAIIDEYQYGRAIGKSAKESIIALKYLRSEKFAGGTLAIANHLANFCDNVDLFTLLGDRDSQEDFVDEKLNKKVKKIIHYKDNSPTIVKRRFLEENQRKLLEFYIINDAELNDEQNKELKHRLEEILPNYDLVIVGDFGHGMINQDLVETIALNSNFLALNTQTNAGNRGYNFISKYPKADFICTDERELRLECRDKTNDLEDLIPIVARKMSCDKIIATHGGFGCITYSSGQLNKIPAFTGTVVDTMGAGDAFFSITAPLISIGIPMEIVGFVGNAVGAMYVKVIGNKEPIDRVSLIKYIVSLMK